jgi:hypothetical protein
VPWTDLFCFSFALYCTLVSCFLRLSRSSQDIRT